MIRTAALAVVTFALAGCPSSGTSDPTSQPAEKAEAPKAADGAAKVAEKKAPVAKAPAAPAPGVPAAVKHATNAKWVDKPTPTDMPALDTKASATANEAAAKAKRDALGAACKAGADKVVRLDGATSRVGYESYKNGNLPVKGKFGKVGGYAVLGAEPALFFWADVLSLNSGDPVRDARLLKLFFEAEKPGNALLTFESDSLTGLGAGGTLPAAGGVIEAKGKLGMHGANVPFSIKLKLTKGAKDGAWKAALAEETLLPFDPFALTAPLQAVMEACNHKSMGTAVKLEFDLNLAAGCAGEG